MARYCAGIGRRVANIGQWRLRMYITTAGNQLFGLEISVIQCLILLAYPTKGQYRESGTSWIGNNWKAKDSHQWWSSGDRWIPMIHNVAPSINFWLGIGFVVTNAIIIFICAIAHHSFRFLIYPSVGPIITYSLPGEFLYFSFPLEAA